MDLSIFEITENQKKLLLEVDKNHTLVVITGKPGCGKTTLKNYLANNGYTAIEPDWVTPQCFKAIVINVGESKKISKQQFKMIELYVSGLPISKISREIKVSRATIYSWLKNENVINEITKLENELSASVKCGD